MYGLIATWRMAKEGVEEGFELLKDGGSASHAIEHAIKAVEDFPYYKSVGYGGLPNEKGIVELDAGYMDGDTFDVGAVGALQDIANPISVAKKLSKQPVNNVLVGQGAIDYARAHQFEQKPMLSDRALIHYQRKKAALAANEQLRPYDGHDTVGMVCLDQAGHMVSATSTSGLFMKRPGRIGDSPIVGSGFYTDSQVGGASATGLGEDLMKGCISYEIVRLMKEGYHPQQACEQAVQSLHEELCARRGQAGDLSVIALNHKGEFGCATNIEGFSFVVATETHQPTVYLVHRQEDGKMRFEKASQAWLDEYMKTRMAPLC